MEFSEVLRRRRMVRSFSGIAPGPRELRNVLDAAVRAPTAGNTDSLDLVVLASPEERQKFWDATTTAAWRRTARRWPGLSRAPVVICLFVEPQAYVARYSDPDKRDSGLGAPESGGGGEAAWPVPFWFFDGGLCVLAMLMAATDSGLGACFLGNFRGEEPLRETLGVPDGYRYVGTVLVGEPGGDDPPSRSLGDRRRAIDEVLHIGAW